MSINDAGSDEMVAMIKSMTQLTNLTEINISENKCGGLGELMAALLKSSKTITKLYANSTNLSDDDLKKMSESIKSLRLTELSNLFKRLERFVLQRSISDYISITGSDGNQHHKKTK